ncbi:hypothetical protein BABINDRAFT_170677 [Babjeviella inositovora NRRL Y-12698]|uniref:Nucleolar protein 9 n=1 Tax=Babjeviella inositovora NRRL Y-12698 TaxID=984486 RepID=A0A1E3QT81_9ASCO|nr:uncharacterized protein BABINDRAFT_170677 [Babjeviella inositovora NRRL Y-12698]ODQ80915.1 hypothetical protein BABINDRAFT_170677 [Babjeviella inositovora NRRL Y-12698]
MAKESKTRGRRAAKAEKKETGDFAPPVETTEEAKAVLNETPTTFFGLVDSQELDYFKQAESTLNVNAFSNEEERQGFIRSVLEESKGKELKLMTNQICSKLVERLLLSCTDAQVKRFYRALQGHFVALANHKYSSHCLETLLVRAAALVEKEILNPDLQFELDDEEEEAQPFVSMENLFLMMAEEFKPQLPAMVTNQYASHVLRLIILILAGKELPSSTVSNSTLRSKRSKIARKMIEIMDNEDFAKHYQTPSSFKDEMMTWFTSIIQNHTPKSMRELSVHKVASPVLQLIIQVEGMVDKQRSFWHLCFLDTSHVEKDTSEGAYVEYLLSDAVGSHFLQNIITHGGKVKNMDRLYKLYMSDRVLRLCNRNTTGCFVIMALMKKLKPSNLDQILDELIPHIAEFLVPAEADRAANLEMVKAIIDTSTERKNYKKEEIVESMLSIYTSKPAEFTENILQLTGSTLGNTRDDWPTAEERRRSLFLQKLCAYDTKLMALTLDGILELRAQRIVQMCKHGVFSHVLEVLLEAPVELDVIKRRKLMNLFTGEIAELACNSYGSHIVDKLWVFTVKLNLYKDRVAGELYAQKEMVKESTYGRLVWKNWSMELFTRKRGDWKALVKQQELEMFPPVAAPAPQEEKKPKINFNREPVLSGKRAREYDEYTQQQSNKIRSRGRR